MQNKGFVKVFALLLTLVCVFYLSFSFVTTYQMNKVDEITKTQGEEAGAHYLDSVMNLKNVMFDELGYINREDSDNWMVVPTDRQWQSLYEEYKA